MLLTFSKDIFRIRIEQKIKIHTIRVDRLKRWRKGLVCHMWMHSPRNQSKNPYCFKDDEKCTGTQTIVILYLLNRVFVDGRLLDADEVEQLAIADGFDSSRAFFLWFKDLSGEELVLIHWTDLRY